MLKLSAGNKVLPSTNLSLYSDVLTLRQIQQTEPEPSAEQTVKANLARAGAGKVVCRLCKGEHFTAKCPYKDSLAGVDNTGMPPASHTA